MLSRSLSSSHVLEWVVHLAISITIGISLLHFLGRALVVHLYHPMYRGRPVGRVLGLTWAHN